MRQIIASNAFNRGLVSPLALARTDQKRVELGARIMTNCMPRVLGSMSFRAGLGYIGGIQSNAPERLLPFVFATTDTALLELTDSILRVWVNDALVTRPAVTSTITNGTFAGSLTGWTTSMGVSYVASNQMQFVGDGTDDETAYQTVTNTSPNAQHALRIVVNNGSVRLRVGSTVNGDDYIKETTLDAGTHSLAFTPTGNFTVYFLSPRIAAVVVGSCTIEAAGIMTLPTPWPVGSLGLIRYDQSADIVFCACAGIQQRKIERRGVHSWSVVLYLSDNGPFKLENVTPTTLTPSATTGNITVTASKALFYATDVGCLFAITSQGQSQSKSITAENSFTNFITITGVGAARTISVMISGTFVATVHIQFSVDQATWTDGAPGGVGSWSAPTSFTFSDGLDNQIIYWRIGVKTGDFTSGTAVVSMTCTAGIQRGIIRLTAYSSPTSALAEVLSPLGSTAAVNTWEKGNWSNTDGWPTCVRFHEGRLWWFGQNGIFGSVSDAFYNFDPTTVGDSGPINRTIGSGPVDTINWALDLPRMVIGAQGSEISIRSSSLDEAITPTNFNVKTNSRQGSSGVDAVEMDQGGIFVQRGGARLFELGFDTKSFYGGSDYNATDLSALVPELCKAGITRVVRQRQPDNRIHCCRNGENPAIMVRDPNEDVICWIEIDTDGIVEDFAVLPGLDGSIEDRVYYVVNRTINGATVRYLEKWAKETECRGTFSDNPALNKQADSFIVFQNSNVTTITGLSNLEGKEVVVWADGIDLSPSDSNGNQTTYTVTGGQITLPTPVSNAVVGLPYTGQWESTKLGVEPSEAQTLLNQQKRNSHIGFVLAYSHAKGLRYGTDFTVMRSMPTVERGRPIDMTATYETYDEQEIEFPGEWETDLSLCLQFQAPRPCTVLAAISDYEIHD